MLRRLAAYLRRIEDGYQDNPYHSRIHAADVVRTLHVVLTRVSAEGVVPATSGDPGDLPRLAPRAS